MLNGGGEPTRHAFLCFVRNGCSAWVRLAKTTVVVLLFIFYSRVASAVLSVFNLYSEPLRDPTAIQYNPSNGFEVAPAEQLPEAFFVEEDFRVQNTDDIHNVRQRRPLPSACAAHVNPPAALRNHRLTGSLASF